MAELPEVSIARLQVVVEKLEQAVNGLVKVLHEDDPGLVTRLRLLESAHERLQWQVRMFWTVLVGVVLKVGAEKLLGLKLP